MIKYPVRVERGEQLALIRDSTGRAIAGGMLLEDAEEFVSKLNAPGSRSKKQRIEEQLRASDLTAQIVERQDIEYGHHETLPRGEHVARIGAGKVRE